MIECELLEEKVIQEVSEEIFRLAEEAKSASRPAIQFLLVFLSKHDLKVVLTSSFASLTTLSIPSGRTLEAEAAGLADDFAAAGLHRRTSPLVFAHRRAARRRVLNVPFVSFHFVA
jgi:hypothetical protein